MQSVAVFFGGKSPEHDISVITGVFALNSLSAGKYAPVPVYVSRTGKWLTGKGLYDVSAYKNLDEGKLEEVCALPGSKTLYAIKKGKLKPLCRPLCVVNAMHGGGGEDGSMAGFLSVCEIPQTACLPFGAAATMDKAVSKTVLRGAGIRTLPCVVFTEQGYFRRKTFYLRHVQKALGFPVIVKPARLGSSIGIQRAENEKELCTVLEQAFRYDPKVVVERALTGFTEINCAAYRGKNGICVSACEKPITSGEILSFADKYLSGEKGRSSREFPAKIPAKTTAQIQALTRAAYRRLGLSGVIRADFLVEESGEVWLNEINTVPGSLAYYLFGDTPTALTAILDEIIDVAVREQLDKESRKTQFDSCVLQIDGIKGGKTR